MATKSVSKSTNAGLSEVLRIIKALAQKSAVADYIYRGEAECYPAVSSSLYRRLEAEFGSALPANFDIEAVQRAELEDAKSYTDATDDFAILTELQHYGGVTNLIDFTKDYLIALFFACYGNYSQDGRVVLLRRWGYMSDHIREPRNPVSRVLAQKSVFVRPPSGYVKPDDTVTIPSELKPTILDYLRKAHGLSIQDIYNDLHGFIRSREIHRDALNHINTALIHQDKGDHQAVIELCSKALEINPGMTAAYRMRGRAYSRKFLFDQAIADYDQAIELNPEHAGTYVDRGTIHGRHRDFDRAIEDFDHAIELNPDDAHARMIRGASYCRKGDFDNGLEDFTRAIEMNPSDALNYYNRGATYSAQDDYDQAIEDYNRAIALNPRYALAYFDRGVAYLGKGDHHQAIADFDQAIDLEGYFEDAYYERGRAFLCLSDWENADWNFRAAVENGAHVVCELFHDYGSATEFEQQTATKLPADMKRWFQRH